jgi:hypothetical protein
MKKLLLITLLLFSVLSFSQVRVNEILPSFIEISNPLIETNHYEFSKYNGKWDEKTNEGSYFFQKLEFRTIEHSQIKYYVLIIHEFDGAYRYPSIKKDFVSWSSLRAYIFTSEQYNILKKYNAVSSNFPEIVTDAISNDGLEDLNIKIINILKSKQRTNYNATFKIKKEDENTIRFILPLKSKYRILESNYGFDKKYFETTILNFDNLFNLN